MQQMQLWYGHQPAVIEAVGGFAPRTSPAEARTACCMSGGVDSLASFRNNRDGLPLDHAGAVKDLLYIYGFDLGGFKTGEENHPRFDENRRVLSSMAESEGAELIPVYTNIRSLEEDSPGRFYTDIFVRRSHAACLAAAAHAFSGRLAKLLIPSTSVIADLGPWGSHPLIDTNYSSGSLAVRHDGLRYSRMEKIVMISS